MEKGKAEIMEQPEQGRELSQPKVKQGRESSSGKKETGADCDKDAASKEEAPAQETADVSEKGPEEKTEGQKRQKKYMMWYSFYRQLIFMNLMYNQRE